MPFLNPTDYFLLFGSLADLVRSDACVCASAFSNETGGRAESLCIFATSSSEAGITGR